MIRNLVTGVAATLLLLVLTLTAAPTASAYLPALSGGMRINNADGSGCSISFTDPMDPWLIYTAAHCYQPAVSREVSAGQYRIGTYRPDLVYDTKLDVVAIQLYKGVNTEYKQCTDDICRRIGVPVAPKVGDYVCKFGSATLQTCGPITQVWSDEFSMKLPVMHGDSGGPVYEFDPDGSVHLVGVTIGMSRKDPSNGYATTITRIADLLKRTWGSDWRMA